MLFIVTNDFNYQNPSDFWSLIAGVHVFGRHKPVRKTLILLYDLLGPRRAHFGLIE